VKGHQPGRGRCAGCAVGDPLDRDLTAGVPLAQLAKKYKISGQSLGAHKRNHWNPALVAAHRKQELEGTALSSLAEINEAIRHMKAILGASVKAGLVGQALSSNRELRQNLEFLARLTGELNDKPDLVVNIAMTSEWSRIRTVMLTTLMKFPDACRAVSDELAKLDKEAA